MCGIHCNNKASESGFYIAATDANAMCITYVEASMEWFLPRHSFWALPKKGGNVTITKYTAVNKTTLTLDFEDGYRIRTSANLNGECLAFPSVMPTYYSVKAVFNTKEFNAALKSIKGLSQAHNKFYLTLKQTSLGTISTLSCIDTDFSTEITEVVDNETIFEEVNTGGFRVRFTQSVLALATNSVDSEQIDMRIQDVDRGVTIVDGEFTYLVMPLYDIK